METSTNNFLLVSVPCNYRNKGDVENICSYSTVIQNNTYKQAAVKYGFIPKVLLGGVWENMVTLARKTVLDSWWLNLVVPIRLQNKFMCTQSTRERLQFYRNCQLEKECVLRIQWNVSHPNMSGLNPVNILQAWSLARHMFIILILMSNTVDFLIPYSAEIRE